MSRSQARPSLSKTPVCAGERRVVRQVLGVCFRPDRSLSSELPCLVWLKCPLLLRGEPWLAVQGTTGRGRLAIRFGFMPTDCERMTVPQHDIGGMEHVCGIKSRGRAVARHGDHEPDEQTN